MTIKHGSGDFETILLTFLLTATGPVDYCGMVQTLEDKMDNVYVTTPSGPIVSVHRDVFYRILSVARDILECDPEESTFIGEIDRIVAGLDGSNLK